jgi:CRP/FNR family transcriptional regulator, cyclic AMP receptor protein
VNLDNVGMNTLGPASRMAQEDDTDRKFAQVGESVLRTIDIFAELSDHDLAPLIGRAACRAYPKGSIIVNEADEGGSLFVILTGTVKVFLSDEAGKEVELTTLGPGAYFGELALFDDAPRSASVIALESCRLSIISKSSLQTLIHERPELSIHLLRGLARRVRELTDNVRTLALLDVYGRLVRALYRMAVPSGEGILAINQRVTQQDFANRIGCSREMVSRVFNDLVKGGYLSVEQHKIVIRKRLPSSW